MRRRMMINGGLKNVITINQTIDDPYSRVSGDVNRDVIRWIRENSHRYLGKYNNGVMYICQLDDDNSNYYYDGTSAVLTGSEGDVFMRMPNFYYCGTEGNILNITFSTVPFDNCVPWMDNTLIGVYEAYKNSSKMYSRSNVSSTGNVSQSTWKTYAANRGTGYQLVDWQMHCVMGCLYYAMYGDTNCQKNIGHGTYSTSKGTGQTDSLGMTDTVAGGNGDRQSINYWGLENWWGNKFEWIHDYNNPPHTQSATVNDPVNGGKRSIDAFNYDGYCPKKMKFGRYLDLIVTTDDPKNGSDQVGYCDFQWLEVSTGSYPGVIRRSNNLSNGNGGVAHAMSESDSSDAFSDAGSRLAFRGSIVEETDVTAFKAITITN